MTLACTASTWRMAIEVNSGKPNTTPAAVTAISGQSPRAGRGARVNASRNRLNSAARAARPMAMNTPDISGASAVPTARRVMGRVAAKMVTPSRPSR